MKKGIFFIGGILITLLFLVFIAGYFWIDIGVKENIRTAKEKYPGKAEDALIAYLLDTTNSPRDRYF